MDNHLYQTLFLYASNPLILSGLIILSTFILEDVATSATALLAAEGIISVKIALGYLLIGIILGDIGLYYLGVWAQKSNWTKRHLKRNGLKKIEHILDSNIIHTVILARFIPGMRFPTYTSLGLFSLDFKKFIFTVIFSVFIWTSLLFLLFFYIGESFMPILQDYYWIGILAMALLFIVTPKIIGFITSQYFKNKC